VDEVKVPEEAKKDLAEAPEKPKIETPQANTPAPVLVPKVTEEPEWHLSKEEWDAHKNVFEQLAEKIPGLEGIANALSPLADAIRDVTDEEVNPTKPKPFMKRKLWGN
jgi:hypothetical protein